jgi:hypothetical protein
MTRGDLDTARPRFDARAGDEQWDAHRFLVRVVPLLLLTPVRAEHLAMVGGEHDDGVVGEAVGVECVEGPLDHAVDQPVQPQVEAAVLDVGGLRVEKLRPEVAERRLRRRAAVERVVLRGGRADLGHRVVRLGQTEELGTGAAERDVVRVHERRDGEPRIVVAVVRAQTSEQVAHLVGAQVAPDHVDEHGTGVVAAHEPAVRAGAHELGVREVPLPLVEAAVPRAAEPVAHRRHGVGIEPRDAWVVRGLGQAVGIGGTVQRRVLPGEHRRTARRARRRRAVVTVELDAPCAEAFTAHELLTAEPRRRGVLVRRRVPLLVGHDHEDVGPCRHRHPLSRRAPSARARHRRRREEQRR